MENKMEDTSVSFRVRGLGYIVVSDGQDLGR